MEILFERDGFFYSIRKILMQNNVQISLKIAINLVIDETSNKILMIQEAKDHSRGLWFLPAGKGKEGETIIETCVRETEEEGGLLTEPIYLLKTEHIVRKIVMNEGEEMKPLDIFKFIFVSRSLNKELKTFENKDSIQAKWFTIDEIKELPLRSIEVLNYIELFQNHKNNKSLLKIDEILEVYHD